MTVWNLKGQTDIETWTEKGATPAESQGTLNATIAYLGSTETPVIVSTVMTLTANLTIPSNIQLIIVKGGMIVSGGYTLTINGSFEAGLYQVFSGFAAGDVTFGAGSVSHAYPEWGGAKGDGSTDCQPGFQLMATALQNTGGKIKVGYGNYKLNSKLTLYSGTILEGVGLRTDNGNPSRLNFSSMTPTSDPAITMSAVSYVSLRDFYLTGHPSGIGPEIYIAGSSRGVTLENLVINTSHANASGAAVLIPDSGTLINSTFKNVRITGNDVASYGFWVSTSSTSIALIGCYVTNTIVAGYLIKGTYIGLYSCASDLNFYDYLIQSASNVGLYSCGGETAIRSAIVALDTTGLSIIGFRSHGNNTGASVSYPSFLDVRNSDKITIIDSRDSSPDAATTYAIHSTTGNAGRYIRLINPNFTLPVHSSILPKGTTANRPTLTTVDVGSFYMDTTLDADGKPIWWNGTAWVDATGATV